MTPRYIIHIGPLKTASTYVQMGFMAAREDLARQGVCYPDEFVNENNKYMHMSIYRALLRDRVDAMKPIFDKLNAEGHHTVILSCEHFVFLSEDAMRALKAVTGATDFTVVYACRRWSDRLTSVWNQTLMDGSAQALPEFYLAMLAGKPVNYYPKWMRDAGIGGVDIDYSISWRTAENVFGRDALQIFPYSSIVDRGEDIYVKFCSDILGLTEAPPTQVTGSRRWASLSTENQEVLRMLNFLNRDRVEHDTPSLRIQFMRRRRDYDTTLITEAMTPCILKMTIDDNDIQFSRAYDNMQAYADRIVGGGDQVFERRKKEAKYVHTGYLLEDGVCEQLRRVYAQVAADMPDGKATPPAPRARGARKVAPAAKKPLAGKVAGAKRAQKA